MVFHVLLVALICAFSIFQRCDSSTSLTHSDWKCVVYSGISNGSETSKYISSNLISQNKRMKHSKQTNSKRKRQAKKLYNPNKHVIRYRMNNSGFANNIYGLVSAYVIAELLNSTLIRKFLNINNNE